MPHPAPSSKTVPLDISGRFLSKRDLTFGDVGVGPIPCLSVVQTTDIKTASSKDKKVHMDNYPDIR